MLYFYYRSPFGSNFSAIEITGKKKMELKRLTVGVNSQSQVYSINDFMQLHARRI